MAEQRTAIAQLGRLLATIGQHRAALAAGTILTTAELQAELAAALADPAMTAQATRPLLVGLLDELGQLAMALGQERDQARAALMQLGQQALARSAYVPPSGRQG